MSAEDGVGMRVEKEVERTETGGGTSSIMVSGPLTNDGDLSLNGVFGVLVPREADRDGQPASTATDNAGKKSFRGRAAYARRQERRATQHPQASGGITGENGGRSSSSCDMDVPAPTET
jgi:hypothetical protein